MTLHCMQVIQSIGTRLTNHNDKKIGKVEDVRIDLRQNDPQYFIICCNELFRGDDHYFAISDHPSLIKITQEGKVIFRVNEETLHKAMSVPADEIPVYDSKTKAVFKLSGYSKTVCQPYE